MIHDTYNFIPLATSCKLEHSILTCRWSVQLLAWEHELLTTDTHSAHTVPILRTCNTYRVHVPCAEWD